MFCILNPFLSVEFQTKNQIQLPDFQYKYKKKQSKNDYFYKILLLFFKKKATQKMSCFFQK
ncbi:hypothetical protein B0A79_23080 [Flavobacterium piscis]|uniref:Transmembrane protein n=1 Tax=Flavobacterium piscis TaxID=1114874 RepID=A0ABX2XII8_9FLAO|nr:hypothetical protein FLP_14070 [Flavobacterium piscis]OXE96499.1 hypothetical protein B0A79_23080 [Flavobacterium piscis]